ncbi:hypothetical protein J4E91_006932 [Alternaria rosae]|nr:hypothetical protein J4E91_006932 [Alternaria rosae]
MDRPLAIRNDDVDTALPSDLCDEILLSGVETPMAEHLVKCRRIAIFVQIIRYRLLCGDIIETLHNQRRKDQSHDELRHRRDQFVADLNVWRLNAKGVALSGSVDDARSSSCFTSPIWFEMIYHNAVLMLHRPSPTLDTSRDSAAVQAIFTSSKASISSYASLHRIGLLNHSWLSLQALFMAGLSYVYAVTMHYQASRRQQGHQPSGLLIKNPSTMEVISDTRTCSNVLVAVSERWKSLQRCVDVFNRLSDAILIDVIKFSTQPVAATHSSTNNTEDGDQQYSDRSDPAVDTHSNGLVQPQWNHATYLQPEGTDQMVSNLSPLAIENEFKGSAFDLQQMYDLQQVDMSVYRFSQAWFDSVDLYGGMGPQLNDMTMNTHL